MAIIRYRFRFPTLPALNPQGRGGATAAVTRAGPGNTVRTTTIAASAGWAGRFALHLRT